MFSFPEINKLTSQFLGEEYNKVLPTGLKPLYAVVPGQPVLKYKYFSGESLDQFAELVADDFRLYALPFYAQFNTLNKLDNYFDRLWKKGIRMEFSVQTGKQGTGSGCCIAAVLCILEPWDNLQRFLKETNLLSDTHRERIHEYISSHSPSLYRGVEIPQ